MSNLKLTPTWHDQINQVETGEPITGGASGNANLAVRQVAENALFLKDELGKISSSLQESYQPKLGKVGDGFLYSLGVTHLDGTEEDGFFEFPHGFMLQWGKVDFASNPGERGYDLTFARPFKNKCFGFFATRIIANQNSAAADGIVLVHSLSKDVAKLNLQHFHGEAEHDLRGFYWLALGY